MSTDIEYGAGPVLAKRIVVKVDPVCRGDKVGIKIFGIAIRCYYFKPCLEGAVHLLNKIGCQKIICIKYKIAVYTLDAIVFVYLFKKEFQSIAFSGFGCIIALVYDCAKTAAQLCGFVMTVIGDYEYL